MTARQFSLSYSTFSPNATYSPSPGLPSPEHHFEDDLISDKFVDNLTSPDNFGDMLSPTTTTSANSHDESAAGAGAGAYPSSTQEVIASAWKRADAAKKADEERDRLLEEMINRYTYVSREYATLLQEVDRLKKQNPNAITANSLYKQDYENLLMTHSNLQRSATRDPFVLVLIDGDGMIFHEHFLSKGEEGGRQAAEILRTSTACYSCEVIPDMPPEMRIVTRMYANVKGLADTCYRAGLVTSSAVIEDFVRGFTRGHTLFDFVDVGPGKDRADEKVSEMFKLHAYDLRCKHIVFGCSHDNGFARLLEKYIFDETITKRVTLLEGLPFGKELLELPFNRSKFGTIFRSEKIVLAPIGQPPRAHGHIIPQRIENGIETAAAAALLRSMSHTPSESVSSLGDTTPYAKPSAVLNWATRAAAAATLPPPTPPADKASPLGFAPRPLTKDSIPRNRKGQRLDPLMRHDSDEVARVRKMKMCNVHYLRGECKYGDKCTHKHDRNPTAKDLEVLKVVARYACCRTGAGCEDPRCIYGHRCQAPERKDPAKWPSERGKTCIFGPECAFPAELHNIDIVPVKTTKVGS